MQFHSRNEVMPSAATRYIALLRGINVGRHVRIGMPELRAMLVDLGCGRPQTLLQSGNLIFCDGVRSRDDLERLLETQIERRFGHRVDCFVRAAAEWNSIARQNPFRREADRDPAHVVAMLLKAAPPEEDVAALRAAIEGRELVAIAERTAYLVYPAGIGNSRVTNVFVEKKLGTRGTARNWNTVLKIAAALEAAAA